MGRIWQPEVLLQVHVRVHDAVVVVVVYLDRLALPLRLLRHPGGDGADNCPVLIGCRQVAEKTRCAEYTAFCAIHDPKSTLPLQEETTIPSPSLSYSAPCSFSIVPISSRLGAA